MGGAADNDTRRRHSGAGASSPHATARTVRSRHWILAITLAAFVAFSGGALRAVAFPDRDCNECHLIPGGRWDCSECHGQSGSHYVHLSLTDPRGPGGVPCETCHDPADRPYFASGPDTDESGHIELDETDVCDTCHSPGGDYDGVDSTAAVSGAMSVGAKDHWDTGVYETTATLAAGKEKWCAGCHDRVPAVVSGVAAPNVIGDETWSTGYGPWGFYSTGHGLPTGVFPASEAPAPDVECGVCHDASFAHIDGNARTYASASDNYQAGYRLGDVGGGAPMDIPRTGGQSVAQFALCFSCHDSDRYLDNSNRTSNFGPLGDWSGHAYHTSGAGVMGGKWDSDWNWPASNRESYVSCPTCHNVHGSPSPVMTRHGELISTPGTSDKVPGFNFSYLTTQTVDCPTLAQSYGGRRGGSGVYDYICTGCHAGTSNVDYSRSPRDLYVPRFQGAYGESGSATVVLSFSEDVFTSAGATGALVPADFALEDVDDGRTVTGVTHTAGEAVAYLTLSSALDGSDDVGVDLLSAATTSSVYDVAGNAMTTATVTIRGETTPPLVSHMSPSAGGSDVLPNDDLFLTLSDTGIGVDWTTFQIQLSGSRGYSETYTDLDSSVVTVSGTPASYRVGVDPDVFFGIDETITVTVSVDDLAGNSAVPPAWWFTTVPDSILDVPAEYGSMQAAIDACLEGWTVRVADGTYSENITLRGKEITVTSVSGAAATKIQGTGANDAVVKCNTGETSQTVIEGFTIDNASGAANAARGFYIYDSAPTIRECDVVGNYVTSAIGGGFYITGPGGGAVIEDCIIGGSVADKNQAVDAAAIYWGNSSAASLGDLVIRRTTISHNNSTRSGTIYTRYATSGSMLIDESTITANSVATDGGGLYFTEMNGVYPTITDSVITSNTAGASGGGVWVYNSRAVFERCDVSHNTATTGDGGGIRFWVAGGTLTDCTVSDNTARDGGGIQQTISGGGPLSLTDCTVTANSATQLGGGIRLFNIVPTATISGTTISDNYSATNGGGMAAQSSPIAVHECTITANSTGLGVGDGGGIHLWSGQPLSVITSSTISGNVARKGAGLHVSATAQLRIEDSLLESNTCTQSAGPDGGGIWIGSNGTVVDVLRSTLRGNRARQGGGVRLGGFSTVNLTNCTLCGNAADVGASGEGGGIYCWGATTTMLNCTLSGNHASLGGGAIRYASIVMSVVNSILYGNTPDEISGGGSYTYTDVGGGRAGTGNIDAPPSYVATVAPSTAPTTAGDYHLTEGSACEGAASSASAPGDDIDRGARPQGTGDDMGSDEIGADGPTSAEGMTSSGGGIEKPEGTGDAGAPSKDAILSTDVERDTGFLLSPSVRYGNGIAAAGTVAGRAGAGPGALSASPVEIERGDPSSQLPRLPIEREPVGGTGAALGLLTLLALAFRSVPRP